MPDHVSNGATGVKLLNRGDLRAIRKDYDAAIDVALLEIGIEKVLQRLDWLTGPGQRANGHNAAADARAAAAMDRLRTIRGRCSRIAEGLGITPQAVHQWEVVPLDRVPEVEQLTGVPRHKLRPDFHLPARRRRRDPNDYKQRTAAS